MRIFLARDWRWPIYEEAFADALLRLKAEIIRFSWKHYFHGPLGRLQSKFPIPGPSMRRLNRDLLKAARNFDPEVIFVWRGTHVRSRALRLLKKETGALLISYNNADPFGPRARTQVQWHHHFFWRLYLKCVPV